MGNLPRSCLILRLQPQVKATEQGLETVLVGSSEQYESHFFPVLNSVVDSERLKQNSRSLHAHSSCTVSVWDKSPHLCTSVPTEKRWMTTACQNVQAGSTLESVATSKAQVAQYVGKYKRHPSLHLVDLEPVSHENREPTCSHFAGT